jgi:hypothetical protein
VRTKKSNKPAPSQLSSEEIEEHKRAADAAHKQISQLADSMAQTKRSLIQLCAECIGAPQEQDTTRLIWHGIVRYANADVSDAEGIGEAFLAFQGFTMLCVNRLRDSIDMATLEDLSFGDLEAILAQGTSTTFETTYEACCYRLSLLHPQFRTMLTWLADPNACQPASRNQALRFLAENGGEGAVDFSLSANDDFDDTGDEGAPFFYWKTDSGYRTILSPVARFILDRLEQYHTDESRLRLTLEEAVPLILCKRPSCGKFAILRRRTKDFCSASCRTLYRQEARPEEHAANQRAYREKFYKKPTRKNRANLKHR